jgi:DNA-binding transcriptional regulator YiaG
MAKNFSELRAKMAPERRTRNSIAAQQILQEIALAELRQTKQVTQAELADRLGVNQAAVSKLERRADMHLSTLANVIEALGGKLELRAEFPDGDEYVVALATKPKHAIA